MKKAWLGLLKHVKTLCPTPVTYRLSDVGFRQWALEKGMAWVFKNLLKLFDLCLLPLGFQVSAFGSGLWEKAWLWLIKTC
ncbi:hypothetical protein [Flectobacillus roseus]|uniref:hypothetical protein n=1 Tax=Flectobacillus roseus TaxID=502259 RepID=UPI0024B6AEBA|nr:hypothetical protein [Flectobacillus roseus]MDI9871067.1 hypothetical protein [Flectobacillus roseus]